MDRPDHMPDSQVETRSDIASRLTGLAEGPLDASSRALFDSLGYRSQRTLDIHSVPQLQELLDPKGLLTEQNALLSRWRSVDFLFQLTDSELSDPEGGRLLLEDHSPFDAKVVKSYVFFALDFSPKTGNDGPT